MESMVRTFVEALILVTLVVFIFLQSIRATIIPLITIPVSLIGTFFFLQLLGLSINLITLFGSCWQSALWWTTPSWWSKR